MNGFDHFVLSLPWYIQIAIYIAAFATPIVAMKYFMRIRKRRKV